MECRACDAGMDGDPCVKKHVVSCMYCAICEVPDIFEVVYIFLHYFRNRAV